jgi:hypothetical protein
VTVSTDSRSQKKGREGKGREGKGRKEKERRYGEMIMAF